MAENHSKTQPRYQIIAAEMRKMIRRQNLEPHTLLPSQSQLLEHFQCSLSTLRHALDDLERSGILYRRHGAGCFVAPIVEKKPILLVGNAITQDLLYGGHGEVYEDFWNFFRGALAASEEENLRYRPMVISRDRLDGMIQQLPQAFPGLGGVIFMRGHQEILNRQAVLSRLKIPWLYCGPNYIAQKFTGYPALIQDEVTIGAQAAAFLAERGYRRIARIGANPALIHQHREKYFCQAAKELGLTVLPEDFLICPEEELRTSPQLPELCRRCDAVYCFTSMLAVPTLQGARDHGFRIPEDVGVLCVDNPVYSRYTHPALSVISIEHVENGKRAFSHFCRYLDGLAETLHIPGKIEVIARESL